MIVPAEQEFRDRAIAARLRMTTGIAIRPKALPVIREHFRNGCRVVVRGEDEYVGPVQPIEPDPPKPARRTWKARAKYRALAGELPGSFRNDRVLTKRIVRELWRAGLTWPDIVGHSRKAPLVAARFRIIRIVSDARPRLSMPSLGKMFNRDHATIIHALRKTETPA